MERKDSSVKIRTTGDLPSIPEEVVRAYPSLITARSGRWNWWDDSVDVIDRFRDSAAGPAGEDEA